MRYRYALGVLFATLLTPLSAQDAVFRETAPHPALLLAQAPLDEAAQAMLREIQYHLNRLGYGVGPLTGALDPQTRRAIGQFQRQQNLPSTVSLGEVLLALRRQAPVNHASTQTPSAAISWALPHQSHSTPSNPPTTQDRPPREQVVTQPAGLRQITGRLQFQRDRCQLNGVWLTPEWCAPFAERRTAQPCNALVNRNGQIYSLRCG